MQPDHERLARLERRMETLEERFADVLAALGAALEAGFGDRAKVGRIAQAAAGKRSSGDGDGKLKDGDGKSR
jgi:hypothetical protein